MSRRSRKRLKQTGQASAWLPKLVMGGVGVAMVLGFLMYFGMCRYLYSESFRNFLAGKIGMVVGVDGKFSPFQWDGFALNVQEYNGTGSGVVKQLGVSRVHTEVGMGKVRQGKWVIKDTQIQHIKVNLDSRPSDAEAASTKGAIWAQPTTGKKSFWIPTQVEMERVEIERLDATLLSKLGPFALSGARVTVDPVLDGAQDMVSTGGHLQVPYTAGESIELERAKMRYSDRQLFLKELRGRVWDTGELDATGEYDLASGAYSLSGHLNRVNCEKMISKDWAKHVQGQLSTDFQVSQRSAQVPSVAKGRLVMENGVLIALPLFDALGAYADTHRFRTIALKEAKTDWRWSDGVLELNQLVLSSESLMRVEGDIGINGDALSGLLRVGVVPGLLARLPGAEEHVFLPGKEGLLWTTVRLGGTLRKPQEDLTDRLVAAAGVRMFEILPETGQKVLKFSKTALEGPAVKALDTGVKVGEKVLESGVDQLSKGVGSLMGSMLGAITGTPPTSNDPKKDEVKPTPDSTPSPPTPEPNSKASSKPPVPSKPTDSYID